MRAPEWTCACGATNDDGTRRCEACGEERTRSSEPRAAAAPSTSPHPRERICEHGVKVARCERCPEEGAAAIRAYREHLAKIIARNQLVKVMPAEEPKAEGPTEPAAERTWCLHEPGTFVQQINAADQEWICRVCERPMAVVDESRRTTTVQRRRKARRGGGYARVTDTRMTTRTPA